MSFMWEGIHATRGFSCSRMSVCFMKQFVTPRHRRCLWTSAVRSSQSEQQQQQDAGPVKTGILMMNMGGPATLDQVQPFLTRLFTDTDIMTLPMQSKLGPWIAKRRAPKVAAKYTEIGGGSPILEWTRKQGRLLVEVLNERRKQSAPHKFYVGFRYADPLLQEALHEIRRDGVKRVIAFSQYPHYSCSTTGSSVNSLAKHLTSLPADHQMNQVQWSLIDRWSLNQGLIDSFTALIEDKMLNLAAGLPPHRVVLLFSAHSLPQYAVNRGDTYPMEVASTVVAIMQKLLFKYPYRLVWQSKVGPLPWLSPATDKAIRAYAEKGIRNFVVIPIAFVNEHIETLHELDIEYGHDLAKELKLENILRVSAPNDHPLFIEGMADEVSRHLDSNDICSASMRLSCPHCTNAACGITRKWLNDLHSRKSV